MTSNVSLGGGTAVFYTQQGGARLGVVYKDRQTLEVVTRSHGRWLREEISLHDLIEVADPAGTTWTRRGLTF